MDDETTLDSYALHLQICVFIYYVYILYISTHMHIHTRWMATHRLFFAMKFIHKYRYIKRWLWKAKYIYVYTHRLPCIPAEVPPAVTDVALSLNSTNNKVSSPCTGTGTGTGPCIFDDPTNYPKPRMRYAIKVVVEIHTKCILLIL